jgi:hypothetical protein
MRSLKVLLFFVAILMVFNTFVLAAVTGAEPIKGETPFLLTNAGQGPGGKMARLLMFQSKALLPTDFDYNAEPLKEDSTDLTKKDYEILFVIIGSSAKGLGASGITIDDEINRLNLMIEEAKELGMTIIAAQIEGDARRGKTGSADERSIDAIIPFADYIIVKKDGDSDGKFTNMAQELGVPITYIDETLDFMQVVQQMFPTE